MEISKEQIEKQAIEEIARTMCRNYMPNGNCAADYEPCGLECVYGYCAERVYCAGYRKQSEGEWIDIRHYRDIASGMCSVCKTTGKVRVSRDDCGIWYINSPYCPNCGAKMKGGAE